MINQSLAHQRILYEDFLEKFALEEVHSQQLLFPVNISFSSDEIEVIYTLKSELESVGFLFEEFKKDGVIVKGIPTTITESQITPVFEQLLEDINLDIPEKNFNPSEMMAESFAKSLAIKTGSNLNEKEQEN